MEQIAVVIPCYRVGALVLDVIARIGPEVEWIFVIDDACPVHTGEVVLQKCTDARVQVIEHVANSGVGGAVISGYKAALRTSASIVVKIDGDGQMDPTLIPKLCKSIVSGGADYVKGNRFYRLNDVSSMPAVRLLGNLFLSFLTKMSSGYWQLFDPTNGFTAIHKAVLQELNLDAISKRYFFESDMLYHLNQLRAVVAEMPMIATYNNELSSLKPAKMIWPFLQKNLCNVIRRILYTYFLRNFSIASLELLLSIPLVIFGSVYGIYHWFHAVITSTQSAPGIVMAAALPLIIGTQFGLSWLNFDVSNQPRFPIHNLL